MREYKEIINNNGGRYQLLRFTDRNAKNEQIEIELTYSGDFSEAQKSSFPYLWEKYGYTKEFLPNYWSVRVFAIDENGNTGEAYNPTIKSKREPRECGFYNRIVLDFDFIMTATDENKKRIIDEIEKRAFVTFEKIRKEPDNFKRYYSADIYGGHKLTKYAESVDEIKMAFYNKFGYMPDIIKEIDDDGATVKTIKGGKL